jgi:hypothetical protein
MVGERKRVCVRERILWMLPPLLFIELLELFPIVGEVNHAFLPLDAHPSPIHFSVAIPMARMASLSESAMIVGTEGMDVLVASYFPSSRLRMTLWKEGEPWIWSEGIRIGARV